MSNPDRQDDRDIRFALRNSPEVVVTVHSDDLAAEVRTYRARLFDLSERGAKLVSSEPISAAQSLRLNLSVEELGLNFYVAAEVCWTRPGEAGTSVFGCSFSPALPKGVFDALAKGGEVNRRFDPRRTCCLKIEGLWELHGDVTPVSLQDYSQGGFCVRTSQPGETGNCFHLCLTEPHEFLLVAKSIWELKVADAYLVGCTFLNSRDFARLDEAVKSHGPVAQEATSP